MPRGSVGLVDERALNVNVDGNLNVAAASLLTDQIRAEGDSTLKRRPPAGRSANQR